MGYYLNIQCPVYIGGINIGEDMQKLDFGQHTASETSGHVFGLYLTCNSNVYIYILLLID